MSDHDDTVSAQERIYKCFPEKDAIRHVTDSRPTLVTDIFKADCVTDLGMSHVNGNRVTSRAVHLVPKN